MKPSLHALRKAVVAFMQQENLGVRIALPSEKREQLLNEPLYIQVKLPLPDKPNIHLPGPIFEGMALTVQIISNGYGMHTAEEAYTIAEKVSRTLHGWFPPVPGVLGPIAMQTSTPWSIDRDNKQPGLELFALRFTLPFDFEGMANHYTY